MCSRRSREDCLRHERAVFFFRGARRLCGFEASGQVTLLEPWFSNRTKSIVKSPKHYLNDTGLLCALLNIRDTASLLTAPSVGAVWETFVLAQLRHRERMAGRERSLFFWRDRTREVDFLAEAAGRLQLFEAKWTELPDATDLINLRFAREALGRTVPVEELGGIESRG